MKSSLGKQNADSFQQGLVTDEVTGPALALAASMHEEAVRFEPENHIQKASGLPEWKTGVEVVDACLPASGLSRHGVHEIEPLRPTDMPSLTGFAFGLLARLSSCQPIIWCVTSQQVGDYGHLYAFGLERYGISPAQIIFTKVNHPLHLHFAMEEALKTDGVAAVIGEGPRPTFTGSRRLSLLCRNYQRPCLLLNGEVSGERGSAALSRWQVTPMPGEEDPHDPLGPGLPTWRVALPRARGGKTMPDMHTKTPTQNPYMSSYPWRIVWDEQTLSFRPTALFSDRTVSQSAGTSAVQNQTLVG